MFVFEGELFNGAPLFVKNVEASGRQAHEDGTSDSQHFLYRAREGQGAGPGRWHVTDGQEHMEEVSE